MSDDRLVVLPGINALDDRATFPFAIRPERVIFLEEIIGGWGEFDAYCRVYGEEGKQLGTVAGTMAAVAGRLGLELDTGDN